MKIFTPAVQVDAAWKDHYDLLVDNHPAMYQPAHVIVNAKLSLTKINDKNMEVSFFGKNIFDKTVYLNGRDFGPPFGVSGVRVGPPATYGVEIMASF
jgi:outer membrane receptor protein involved in Fe transport